MINTYQAFKPYTEYLSSLLVLKNNGNLNVNDDVEIVNALNGGCSDYLRRSISLDTRRNNGAFFTGLALCDFAIQSRLNNLNTSSIFCDPACGAGDLLLSVAKLFPIEDSLESTLMVWGRHLYGRDINPTFITAAKYRIALLAMQRGAKSKSFQQKDIDDLLPEIRVGDGLEIKSNNTVTNFLMNPPYIYIESSSQTQWANGKVNVAAVFVDRISNIANDGDQIIAILPDVLRSGSRYQAWRELVSKRLSISNIDLYGQFDSATDVDVFVLDAKVSKKSPKGKNKWGPLSKLNNKLTVQDKFRVCVGPVVPFRNKGLGSWFPFLHAKNLRPWKDIGLINENIRFNGTGITPPFVVIRRTSRFGDTHRAVANLVRGEKSVAVENHLIVCAPLSNKVSDCKKLISILKSSSTSNWLDSRIRCRHLTVTAVREVPWLDKS